MQSMIELVKVDPREMESFIALDADDIARVVAMRPTIEQHADEIVEGLYRRIQQYPAMRDVVVRANSTFERLAVTQRTYLLQMFGGDYGAEYVERRLRIGVIHNQIGLTPRWYLGAYAIYRSLIFPHVLPQCETAEMAMLTMSSIDKVMSLDAQLAIETYNYCQMEDLRSVTTSKDALADNVKQLGEGLARIADGDLRQQFEIHDDDVLADVRADVNHLIERTSELARRTGETVHTMATSLAQVNQSLATQTSGVIQQASAVAETSTTLEEMRATSGQTLARAESTAASAHRVQEEGARGLTTIGQVTDGMEGIQEGMKAIAATILSLSEQIQQIGEITDAVSNISQQSKMLALNASIEAAKAGEAGRGFSVVAAEVRDLADQSHQATTAVKRILGDIRHAADRAVIATESGGKEVTTGLALVGTAGDAMQALMDAISESATSSEQIVAAVRQESIGISQAAHALAEINEVTGQFVTAAEDTRNAAGTLTEQYQRLQELASYYQLSK